jgi:beta-galactosidase
MHLHSPRPRLLPFALALLLPAAALAQDRTQSLAGTWRFALDRSDVGIARRWFDRDLPDRIHLPGILEAQGYGDPIGIHTPWVLSLYDHDWYLRADYKAYTRPGHVQVPFLCQPPRHYVGVSWYQREIDVPAGWAGLRVELHLERTRWLSTVWVDSDRIGSVRSLVAPHDYDLGRLAPGRHRLTIRLDTRMQLPYRPDAHSISDSLGGAWNGIVGKIELKATSPVWIEDAEVFPNLARRTAAIRIRIGNESGRRGMGLLSAGGVTAPVAWTVHGVQTELDVPLGPDAALWDEFHPVLQHLTLRLTGPGADDRRELTFGLRQFGTEGQSFTINGRKVNLRFTHDGGDFPLTGYPPTDVASWTRIFRICQQWGLNGMRFHSWCPPQAAFTAADQLGFFLQPECGMWNAISPGTPMDKELYAETRRILKAYGNHPSFVMLSPSNEPSGRWKEALPPWIAHFRAVDPRHLYCPGTGWSYLDAPGPARGVDFLINVREGYGYPLRGPSAWFGGDYDRSLKGVDVPVLAHELGQWAAYPDYSIIRKFTGYLRPGNYEIFRDSLAAHGMLDRDRDFAWASGRYQLACYKQDIEANLRTAGMAGFELLDLHDYIGQGTAPVGVLDTFWDDKGYVQPAEWRQFCSNTVPLARLRRRVFTTADELSSGIEMYHFGPVPLVDAVGEWRILDASGRAVASGRWPAALIPIGKNFVLGNVAVSLAAFRAPAAYKLVVDLRGTSFENSWKFWVYPARESTAAPPNVLVTRSWDAAKARLASGGRVLFLPRPADLPWTCPPLDVRPIFWNRQMVPAWSRMLGLWNEVRDPALAEFPTEAYCDWQWSELVRDARAINLGSLPAALQPIVQPIDDWNRNWKLGLLFECRVGPGRLMVCSADLTSDLDHRPAARQLRRSVLDYMGGPKFDPAVAVPAADLDPLWFDSLIMRHLGATARAQGEDASAAIDGNPNTAWTDNLPGRGAHSPAPADWPHVLTVSFPRPVAMNGLVLMPRQNDRNHTGDIRGYAVEVSSDGRAWREVARGELESTFDPQTVRFGRTITARHLRFSALSGFGDDTSTALAELAVLYAGPKLADAGEGTVDYRRAGSSSGDVIENAGGVPPAGPEKR